MENVPTSGVDVFYSYAHKDEPLREALEKHLMLLQHQGYIRQWHDRCIRAGTPWAQAIDTHLNTASLILLLISADFISSPYCYDIEMKRALERHHNQEAHVVPIIVRPVDWQSSPFAELQVLPKNGKPITKWKNRDEAFQDVARGLRSLIEEMRTLQPAAQSPQSSPNSHWHVPYHRNPFFTNREKTLTHLYHALHTTTMKTTPRALSGMSGIGKTQAAVEYAYRYRQHYEHCFWLSSDTQETLLTDMLILANHLDIPEKRAQDQQATMRGVRRWLQEHQKWLLIFDNADNLAILRDFLPQDLTGHIILTTQAYALGGLAQRVDVEHMGPQEGALFLLRRAGILSSDLSLSDAPLSDGVAARTLCDLVGGLPLALDQAGAYIEEVACSVEEYLSLYRTRQAELLKWRGGVVNDHPESIANTLALSLQKIEQASNAAADLLRFLSFFHPDVIPEEILKLGAAELGPVLHPVVLDPLLYNDALKELLKFSLVHRDPSTRTLTLHRLTQTVVQDTLSEAEQQEWARRAVFALNRAFPNPRFSTTWDLCQRCFAQGEHSVELIKHWHLSFSESVHLLNRLGYYLMRRGRHEEAERFYQDALDLGKQAVGEEHPAFADSLFRLGELLYITGNYREAERLYQQALTIREQTLGREHPDVALSLHNMALLYAELGRKPAEREALYLRALELWEKAYGPHHPDVAEGLNNLASLYRRLKRFTEAEALLHRALAIRKEAFGEENPDTVVNMETLAELYLSQNKDEQAEPLLRAGLLMCERVLGKDHPYMARFLSGLRQLALHQHNYPEAEQYIQQTIAIDARSLGNMHPYMLEHYCDLASVYTLERRYEDAERVYRQTLKDAEKTEDLQHEMIANILMHLAEVSILEGKNAQAGPLYQRALTLREKTLGSHHPDVAATLERLVDLSRTMHQDTEATRYGQRLQEIRSQIAEQG